MEGAQALQPIAADDNIETFTAQFATQCVPNVLLIVNN
jgi:hypothetical protein